MICVDMKALNLLSLNSLMQSYGRFWLIPRNNAFIASSACDTPPNSMTFSRTPVIVVAVRGKKAQKKGL